MSRTSLILILISLIEPFFFLLDNLQFSAASIDAFYVCSKWSNSYSMFITRARKLGLNQPIIGPANIYSRSLEKNIGKEAMRGIAGFSLYNEASDIPENMDFIEKFKKYMAVFHMIKELWATQLSSLCLMQLKRLEHLILINLLYFCVRCDTAKNARTYGRRSIQQFRTHHR